MAYAERTTVAFEKSIAEIMALLRKRGAEQVGQMEEANRFMVGFRLADRQVRFTVSWDKNEQQRRQRARALLLVIKAKLESIDSQVETFEQAFLANIVMSDGRTVYERVHSDMALEYRSGQPTMYLIGGPEQ